MNVEETLRRIVRGLTGNRRTRFLGRLLRKSLEVDRKDYEELNRQKRKPIQDAVLDPLLSAAETNSDEEFNPSVARILERLPRIVQKAGFVEARSEESKFVGAFRDVEFHQGVIRYDDPPDVLSTMVKMSHEDEVLFPTLRNPLGLRDKQDYDEIKRSFLNPMLDVLRSAIGARFRDSLYSSFFKLGQLYGLPPLKKLKAEDVYDRGQDFYRAHRRELVITFSTSSGLTNPLEHYGTDYCVEEYAMARDTIGDLVLKNPARRGYFKKGLLNGRLSSRRLYVWEREGTAKSLQDALRKVPDARKERFTDDAIKLLGGALMHDRMRIVELDKLDGWMRRFTCNAKNEILFTIRGSQSKHISHALHMSFDLSSMAERRKKVQRFLNIASAVGLAHVSVAAALWVAIMGEDVVYSLIESWLTRPARIDEEISQCGRIIKDYDRLDKHAAVQKARGIIEDMLGLEGANREETKEHRNQRPASPAPA